MCCNNCKEITLFKGTDGVGISSIVPNNDGTLTFYYTNGTSYTSPNLTGPQGPGNSFSNRWTYNTTTAGSFTDIPNGQVRFNATTSSATKMFISYSNFEANDLTNFLNSFTNITSSVPSGTSINRYGEIKLFSINQNKWINYKILNLTYNLDHLEIDIFNLDSSNPLSIPFNNNENIVINFVPNLKVVDTLYYTTNWNMDTLATRTIAMSNFSPYITDYKKIINVSVTIQDNTQSVTTPLNLAVSGTPEGSVFSIDTNGITLLRTVSGGFDNPSFNNAIVNILIEYLR